MSTYARRAWIDACTFAEARDAAALAEVRRRVRDVVQGGSRAVVVLDVDSTLYEVKTRTYAILKEWVAHHRADPTFAAIAQAMQSIEQHHVGYSLKDTLRAVGLEVESQEVQAVLGTMKQYWIDRFFQNPYLKHDVPYPGAAEWVRRLHGEDGADVVYLTGRDEPNMGTGTRERLRLDGFPLDVARTHTFLKANADIDDVVHKETATEAITRLGRVVASFENEPKNLAALYAKWPQAMHVFVETDCSDHPAPAVTGLYHLARWP